MDCEGKKSKDDLLILAWKPGIIDIIILLSGKNKGVVISKVLPSRETIVTGYK